MSTQVVAPQLTPTPNCGTCFSRGRTTPGVHLIGKSWMCSPCFNGNDEWTLRDRAQLRDVRKAATRERRAMSRETARLAREAILADIKTAKRSLKPVTRAVQLSAASFGIEPQLITWRTNAWNVSRPRQLACRIAYDLFGLSLPHIGRSLGYHHTTVLSGVRSARRLPELAERYEQIAAEIKAAQ